MVEERLMDEKTDHNSVTIDTIVRTLQEEGNVEASFERSYAFWEKSSSYGQPDTELYLSTVQIYMETLGLEFDDFIADYEQMGKRVLYLAEVKNKLDFLEEEARNDFLRRIAPHKDRYQGIFNAFLRSDVKDEYENICTHMEIGELDIELNNPDLKFLGSPYISGGEKFVEMLCNSAKNLLPKSPKKAKELEAALDQLKKGKENIALGQLDEENLEEYINFIKAADVVSTFLAKNLKKQDLYDSQDSIKFSYDQSAYIGPKYGSKSLTWLENLLKEYARESRYVNTFAQKLSRKTGKVVLVWCNLRGGYVATRSMDSTLTQLDSRKREDLITRVLDASEEENDVNVSKAVQYDQMLKSGELDWATLMLEGKIPSSPAGELKSYFCSVDHLNEYKRRVEKIVSEVDPIIVFVDRSSSYRFPTAAQRFQGFMEEEFSDYEITGVLAYDTGKIVRDFSCENIRAPEINLETGIKRDPGAKKTKPLVSKDYFDRMRKKVIETERNLAIILNPDRKTKACKRHNLSLGFDDDVPEFFGLYQGQTTGRELFVLTKKGAQFFSNYANNFLKSYSGWNRKNADLTQEELEL